MSLKLALVSVLALSAFGACESKTADAPSKTAVATKDVSGEGASAHADHKGHEAGGDKDCIYAQGHADKKEGHAGCGDESAPASGSGHFGAAFSLDGSKALAATLESDSAEPVQVHGEIEAVCQKRGCWMVLKDGTKSARVMMKDHGFTLPMDSRGKKAVVEGVVSKRTFSEGQVKHLEKDAGKDPSKVSGERTEYIVTASGVEIRDA